MAVFRIDAKNLQIIVDTMWLLITPQKNHDESGSSHLGILDELK